MSTNTKIEWTDATWNPIVGCTRVSEGCMNCYAERFAARFHERFGGVSRMTEHGPRWTGKIVLRPETLGLPLRWRKPRRVFVNSMSDLFHPDVPDDFIDQVFAVMALCPQHTFQVLTKRPERMIAYLTNLPKRAENTPALPDRNVPYEDGRICEFLRAALGPGTPVIDRKWPLSNVWLGVSVENQQAADERIPLLLQTPAAVRFLSCEPLLGPVDLTEWLGPEITDAMKAPGARCGHHGILLNGNPCKYCFPERIDWIIVGGESGPGARPMHPDWVRSIRDQCKAAEVPFFFKQWGEWKLSWMAGEYQWMRVGKKAAGRLLDGRTWDELPVVVR